MKQFFTILLAASCLTAIGQGGGQCTDCLACNYGQIENCVYPPIDGQTCSGGCLGFGSDPYGGSAVVDVAITFQDPEIMELWVNIYNWIDPSLSSAIGQVILTINDEVYGTLEMYGPIVHDCGVDDGFGYGSWTYENFNFIPMTHSLWQCGSNELLLIHVPPAISLCAPVVIWEGTVDNPLIPVDAVGVCGGDCELDWNGNGVCDDIEVFGCTYSSANNFNSWATADDGSCVFENNANPPCGEGTTWDDSTQTCIVANPSDSNFDGCVQLNDLLDLLGAFGNCAAVESVWQCGDPLEYQGYDYATVLIGEQCWFAENLRSENYSTGGSIPANVSDSNWQQFYGQLAVYGEGSSFCNAFSPNGDACDESWSLNEYGRLYNFFCVWAEVESSQQLSLCPSGWHVPSDEEWSIMTNFLGGPFPAGGQMKTDFGWCDEGNGTNTSGYSGLPGGRRDQDGNFDGAGSTGFWWSSSIEQVDGAMAAVYRGLESADDNLSRQSGGPFLGLSVRCIKDAE